MYITKAGQIGSFKQPIAKKTNEISEEVEGE
jgi:hypothetical protein